MRVFIVALLGLAWLGGLPQAHAQAPAADVSDAKSAKEMVRQGNALYRQGKFADALKRYEYAAQVQPRASTTFNRAQCHRKLGQAADAIRLYEEYLRQAPQATDRAIVLQWVATLKVELAKSEPAPEAVAPEPVAPSPPPQILPRAAVSMDSGVAATETTESARWYRRWYVWAGAAVVVGGIVAGTVMATRGTSVAIPHTNVGNMDFFPPGR